MARYIFTLLYFFLFLISQVGQAQFCSGSLGENIFVEGNFGTGSDNILSPNPNIAPGYNYVFVVPPLDGDYVLTNNTASWPQLFPSWLGIGDNSEDPNGYMMVVNASNAPGLFYEQTISGLCENTFYEFSADIINLIKTGTPNHIDPDVSFLLDGTEFFSTGNIPKTNSWTTYGFTFTTQMGQESMTLSLRNNAPGGNGNDLALDNISFRACGPEISISPEAPIITLCEDDLPIEFQAVIVGSEYLNPTFQWQQSSNGGITWNDVSGANQTEFTHPPLTPGMYFYRFLVADGLANLDSDKCRVNSVTKVINVPNSEFPQTATICDGLTFEIGNSIYSQTGIYRDTFVNVLGCDSILITDLTVVTNSNILADISVSNSCANLADGSISIDDVSGGTPPYNFTFEGIDFGTTGFFPDLAGGATYSVVIEDAIGCSLEISSTVEQPSDLTLNLGEDQEIELGESITISPIYNFVPTDFTWQVDTLIDCIDFNECNELSFIPLSSQLVILELFDDAGCSVTDSVLIEVNEARDISLPTAFSPNGDGINDLFTVLGSSLNVKNIEEFRIFNRWGNLLFTSNNFQPNSTQNGWDGTHNGNPAPIGVYVFTATVRFIDEQVLNYSGSVTIVR